MKKIGTVFILLMLILFSLSACSAGKTTAMQLLKTELTKEEKDIVELLGLEDSALLYDYTADETLQSIHIQMYYLDEDSNWRAGYGGSNQLTQSTGRLALQFDKIAEGAYTAVQNASGTNTTQYTTQEKINGSYSSTTTHASDTVEIDYEQEIPLAIQIYTSQSTVVSYDVEYFFEPEAYQKYNYEHVYAITVLFSQKRVS